ncbi:hypothetical protein CEXT_438751 [Caerostris extrusa]|uniref:Ionotropic glutamate receptor L-glutamate and glycine-binding domain-containing protein n=1 Tax=Caerostris extrusa TaxID=172846 RepID=A0AAV4XTG1_CAEEX|nr:hypothetical protein CEXT_438751 [Caerostris extrusa]
MIAVSDIKPGGTEGQLLELLSQALHFKYKLVTSTDGQVGTLQENGSWNGIVGLISRGEADIGLTQISVTKERLGSSRFQRTLLSQ